MLYINFNAFDKRSYYSTFIYKVTTYSTEIQRLFLGLQFEVISLSISQHEINASSIYIEYIFITVFFTLCVSFHSNSPAIIPATLEKFAILRSPVPVAFQSARVQPSSSSQTTRNSIRITVFSNVVIVFCGLKVCFLYD